MESVYLSQNCKNATEIYEKNVQEIGNGLLLYCKSFMLPEKLNRSLLNDYPYGIIVRHSDLADCCKCLEGDSAASSLWEKISWNLTTDGGASADSDAIQELLRKRLVQLFRGITKKPFYYQIRHADSAFLSYGISAYMPSKITLDRSTLKGIFGVYDVPLLLSISERKNQQKEPTILSSIDLCANYPRYDFIFKNAMSKEAHCGVKIIRSNPNTAPDFVSVPSCCSVGRLEIYNRFFSNKHKKNTHMFRFFTRGLHKDDSAWPTVFSAEDAWYYEMCTGLSLVTELTAFFLSRNIDIAFWESQTKPNDLTSWQMCRCEVLFSLLKTRRLTICACPAIRWRIEMLLDILDEIDTAFSMEEKRDGRLMTRAQWEDSAFQKFYCLFEKKIEEIPSKAVNTGQLWHICNPLKPFALTGEQVAFLNQDEAKTIKHSKAEWLNKVYLAYMAAAHDMADSMKASIRQDIVTNCIMDLAEIVTPGVHLGEVFPFCCIIHPEDGNVKALKDKAMATSSSGTRKTKKLKNNNLKEQVFEIVHKALYQDDITMIFEII